MSSTAAAQHAEAGPPQELSAEQAAATMRSRPYIVLLVFAAIVGVIVSVAAWCFLELVYQTQQEIYVHLPHAVGYPHGEPVWWPIPVLLIAGVIVAAAISKLPGNGGHIPAFGLAAGGPPKAPEMPGILLAGIVSIGLGVKATRV